MRPPSVPRRDLPLVGASYARALDAVVMPRITTPPTKEEAATNYATYES